MKLTKNHGVSQPINQLMIGIVGIVKVNYNVFIF